MSRRTGSIDPGYFESMYAADPDPWRFATSDYERAKYADTLDALPPGRFAAALEVGCSIGVFTRTLAARCDGLLAIDVSPTALETARRANGDIRFELRRVPAEWPAGSFDLIVLSEVLYYLDRADLAATAGRVRDSLRPGGTAVLVHWLGLTDYPLTGDEAAEAFIEASRLTVVTQRRRPEYRLDLLQTGV